MSSQVTVEPPKKKNPKSLLGVPRKKGAGGVWEDPPDDFDPYANKFIRVGEKFQCNVPSLAR